MARCEAACIHIPNGKSMKVDLESYVPMQLFLPPNNSRIIFYHHGRDHPKKSKYMMITATTFFLDYMNIRAYKLIDKNMYWKLDE